MITLTIDDFAKQMKWMFLLLYFCPNVKKSFLLKVSFVDSREKITKYLVGDVLVSEDLSDSEEMGGMPSLPEPDPIRHFLMDHPLYPELQRLGIRNSMSFVPFTTGAKSLLRKSSW